MFSQGPLNERNTKQPVQNIPSPSNGPTDKIGLTRRVPAAQDSLPPVDQVLSHPVQTRQRTPIESPYFEDMSFPQESSPIVQGTVLSKFLRKKSYRTRFRIDPGST